ncbi:enoyl-CoA hydratase/isomerase family protein [Phenylobacterium aquaticum]|uniref:enoyl-CoA hydratase/isomerase family protein n=1 Tax=Phenylobacterium aquaticum TaxID=1763816 RepID=UPI0026EA1D52|nr:enoyl-CoA hydratase/isomerase family protein [Phenylobacterium aquaticum]
MAYPSLNYAKLGEVGVVTFATPARLNAISAQRLDDLEAVLTDAEADPHLRALVLTGEGDRAFCVGLDLDLLDICFADLARFQAVVTRVAAIIARIEALPIPTLAAINGLARAGGFEFALGCDFIMVADEARFGDAHTDSGVLPAAVTTRLKRKIGDQRAKALIWSARYLSGAEAVEYGLALRSVPRARLLEESLAFLATLIDKPRATLAASKAVLQQTADLSLDDAVALELRSFQAYMAGEPYGREGYTAFREKRPPSWKVLP